MNEAQQERLRSVRRDLHSHPEPAWREFYTTSRIVDEIERIGVDQLYTGRDVVNGDARMAVPDDNELEAWQAKARDTGTREDVLEAADGGFTGALAVLKQGEGPTVALRVDIDALPITEADSVAHAPAAEEFRSTNEGYMHACGHDAHATIGLGVLEAVKERDFRGTFKVVFQPAEEVIGGGKAVAESGHLDDVDHLLAIHIGLDHPTGEIVAGVGGFLAVRQFRATFTGETAHAGGHPAQGRDAVQALATAVQNLHAIRRHGDGATRVNAGVVEGGTATNIVPEEATLEGEVRGETTPLKEYMSERADTVMSSAAEMHDCEVDIETTAEAPSAVSDDALADVVYDAAESVSGVTSRLRTDDLGGSEDATYLMDRVQGHGGTATFVGIGTDHPGGHHTPLFDVDEDSLAIGVDVVSEAISQLSE
ncbi:N-acyl-L-amino acid amidohydrolase [Haloarcula rubripromontorii]|uniref:N-acyl-L-amino acid amidohydrolase n=1 Tax=Haloarcula rubripromontorii TaxID=1705562 RepID=A0A0N0U965_9EURY|nr:amidohydrolase [Haloarcula rubripromontorii]KOX92864.1 N-acyl-L-amino acid amidohydrolase [Haloarcula rubripromontorii]